ncbi:MAG TPA: glycosyltransferase family 39 protein [Candidatus Acidoferrum sp.]|nr:glycosyltransferase family 39 protein [Candidatus Acidoferrum sp.]
MDRALTGFVGLRQVRYTLRPEKKSLRERDTPKGDGGRPTQVRGRSGVAAWLTSDVGLLVVLAVVRVVIHTATNGQYGFHRDELQTLDDARHLDWGFVVYPPVVPLLARLELLLFGTSLAGFRVLAAVAVSAAMVLAGLIAKELGGGRREQMLAAVATGVSPVSLAQGAVFQYVSFDYLWCVLLTYFLVRLLKTENARWWLAIGAAIGVGMQTKYTMAFFAVGVAGGVLLTPARRYLSSVWLWAGVAVALILFLPNLVWQAQHHFISLEFLKRIHARDVSQGRTRGFLVEQLLLCINPFTIPLLFLGLWFYFVRDEGRRYRLLGWAYVATLAIFVAAQARFYYLAPMYPVLLAAGSALWGQWLRRLSPGRSRTAQAALWTGVAAGGVMFSLIVLPVAPMGSSVWNFTSKVHDQFREEIGWPELAQNVARVYQQLPAEEQKRTGILTGNYGEAGALNLYGPGYGLPRAMAGTNSFWYRGYTEPAPETVIVVGFDLDEAEKLFSSCRVAAKNTNRYDVVNEESRDHPDILLCRNLREGWPEFWRRFRRFG